ncbi:MAG: response regulator [Chitinophagaceae bacterium]|nr:MAG: response regulator [Chitinophagaceae bacterium]
MQKLANRILLVDDDADDRYIMHQAFTELHFENEVKMFCSGSDLLGYLEQLPRQSYPDLLVLDFNMPAINGAELALYLRRQESYRDIPVVLYSTGMSPKMQKDLLAAGVLRCYEKGMEYGNVLELAKSLVELVLDGNDISATHGIRFESLSES